MQNASAVDNSASRNNIDLSFMSDNDERELDTELRLKVHHTSNGDYIEKYMMHSNILMERMMNRILQKEKIIKQRSQSNRPRLGFSSNTRNVKQSRMNDLDFGRFSPNMSENDNLQSFNSGTIEESRLKSFGALSEFSISKTMLKSPKNTHAEETKTEKHETKLIEPVKEQVLKLKKDKYIEFKRKLGNYETEERKK